ncbi:MAG: BLUF domain-containing protein [Pseudomonadota bacterium]
MLHRLIYFSERDRSCGDVRALVREAAERNRRRGITGLLIADDRCFLQMLEGHRNAVSSLFQTISRDTRHRNIVLVDVEETDDLCSSDWAMERMDDARRVAETWRKIDFNRAFDPWSMSAEEIRTFFAMVMVDLNKARNAPPQLAARAANE